MNDMSCVFFSLDVFVLYGLEKETKSLNPLKSIVQCNSVRVHFNICKIRLLNLFYSVFPSIPAIDI